ncbi:hypothetical protein BB558_003413 [Smittium angustum]|uniref:Uncharacterized protein n=1 Tax=Smittium angustum TaxID=133377 RepID=A0A2U1J604_SMIAN|nr:hypothetical protein BB558_003413 [Smittium angustum]
MCYPCIDVRGFKLGLDCIQDQETLFCAEMRVIMEEWRARDKNERLLFEFSTNWDVIASQVFNHLLWCENCKISLDDIHNSGMNAKIRDKTILKQNSIFSKFRTYVLGILSYIGKLNFLRK